MSDRSRYHSHLSVPAPALFLPADFQPLPVDWTITYEKGKLVAWSPDPDNPNALVHRSDVLLRQGVANDSSTIVTYKSKPVSSTDSQSIKRSTASTPDALGTLLSYDAFNPSRHKISKDNKLTSLHLSSSAFVPPRDLCY